MPAPRRTRPAHTWRVLLVLALVSSVAVVVIAPALTLEPEDARGPEVPEGPHAANNSTDARDFIVSPSTRSGGST